MGFFNPYLVIIISKSLSFFGLDDLVETKGLKKINKTKLALITSLKTQKFSKEDRWRYGFIDCKAPVKNPG